jgi:hypothetical protein
MSKNSLSSEMNNSQISSIVEKFKTENNTKFQVFKQSVLALRKKLKPIQNLFADPKQDSEILAEQQEEMRLEIDEAFKATVGKSFDDLAEYLETQDDDKASSLLFEQMLTAKILAVLEAIKSFQETVSKLDPKATDKIVDYLVVALAVIMPGVALSIKANGVVDSVKSFLKTENINKMVDSWKEKLTQVEDKVEEISKDPKLKTKYQLAQQIIEVAEKVGVSPLSIAELGLNFEELKKVNQVVNSTDQDKNAFADVVRLLEQLPKNLTEDSTTKNLAEVKNSIKEVTKNTAKIIDSIPNDSMPEAKKSLLNYLLVKELAVIKESLTASFDPKKSVMQRLESCQKVSNTLLAIEKKIEATCKSKDTGDKAILAFKGLVQDKMQDLLPKEFLQSKVATSQIPQIGHALKLILERSASKSQGAGLEK